MAERHGGSHPQGGKSKAESARPDFSDLLIHPPETTEGYWRHPTNYRYLGAQAMELSADDLRQHVIRIEEVERAYSGAVMPLEVGPGRLREQLRIRPANNFPIEVPAMDVNTTCLYYSSPEVLAGMTKGKRRAAAAYAYPHLGALNYAEDLGHYMAPMIFAMAMKSPFERDLEEANGNLEAWSLDQLVGLADDLESGRTQPGSRLYEFVKLVTHTDHQPGRINFTTALLLETSEYFTFHHDDLLATDAITAAQQSNEIATSSLALARHLLGPRVLGEYPYRVLGINRFIANQLARRVSDIESVDIARRLRGGEIDYEEAWAEFADVQLDYLESFRRWRADNPDAEGLAFEWLTSAILNASVYNQNLIGTAYSRSSTAREDYPEDNAKGNLSSAKQSHDVLFRDGGERTPLQCKTGSCDVYATPPVHVVKAKAALDITKPKPDLMEEFEKVADNLKKIYLGDASRTAKSEIDDIGQRMLTEQAA